MKIAKGGWVVACDGRKALILENVGDAMFPNLRTKETYEHADEPTHVLGTSPPGRSHQSVGNRRSSVEQTDLHDETERTFLHDLAARLDGAISTGKVKVLTLVAAPRALGMIRKAYSPTLRDAIVHEIAKDVVNRPIFEIENLVLQSAEE